MEKAEHPLIIAIAGRKQSGKSTLGKYIVSKHPNAYTYSFAGPLKRVACSMLLGIPEGLTCGSDDDKNKLTKYTWDKLPMSIREAYSEASEEVLVGVTDYWAIGSGRPVTENEYETRRIPRSGRMTVREVMQVIGTDVFRNMFDENIWCDAAIRRINEEGVPLAVITDCRFPSEVNTVIAEGGYIIRLKRKVCDDNHASETALDDYNFESLGDRCLVIDNANMTIEQKNAVAWEWLTLKIFGD